MSGWIAIPRRPLAEKLIPFILFALALWGIGDGLSSIKDMKFPSLWVAWPILILLLLGSALNWGVEGKKWAMLANLGSGLSYRDAMKGVLAGVAIGMWMPGRVGAWLGKLHFVPRGKRSEVLFPLMASSAAQFLVTVLMAILAALFWWGGTGVSFEVASHARLISYGVGFTLLFGIGAVGLYTFLHSGRGKRILDAIGFRSEKLLSFRELSPLLYAKVLGLATLRYLVFLSQFVLALGFWSPETPLSFFFLSVPFALFIISVLPSFVLAKLGVREMVIVAIMAPVSGNEGALIMASLSIWLVNLALPALLGAFFLFASRFSLSPQLDR